jgi:hypothetical protein
MENAPALKNAGDHPTSRFALHHPAEELGGIDASELDLLH